MIRILGIISFAICFVFGAAMEGPKPAHAQKKMTDITFSLDFITLGRHAPWYVTLEKGFYRDEGLNVKIIQGKGSAQVMQAVQSGVAQIGFVDVASLVLGRARGGTIKMVAVNYQKAPYTIFSLDPGANVMKPKDLEGLTLGSSAGSFLPEIHKALMRKHGLDPSKLRVVNIAPPARVAALATKKVPAVDFFIMSLPLIEGAVKGKAKVRAFLLADHGLELYSNGIGAKQDYIKKNPDIIRRFVRASLKGWKYAMDNPAEAADLQRKHKKALKKGVIIKELAIVKRLSAVPDTKKHGYGWFSPAKMKAAVDLMVTNAKIDKAKAPKATDMYVSGFLPKKPFMP
jgi:NitT/TauT family transport system substrate-binding protein